MRLIPETRRVRNEFFFSELRDAGLGLSSCSCGVRCMSATGVEAVPGRKFFAMSAHGLVTSRYGLNRRHIRATNVVRGSEWLIGICFVITRCTKENASIQCSASVARYHDARLDICNAKRPESS